MEDDRPYRTKAFCRVGRPTSFVDTENNKDDIYVTCLHDLNRTPHKTTTHA
ncbi:34958_t:CDS:2, partial [Racocetra persica]